MRARLEVAFPRKRLSPTTSGRSERRPRVIAVGAAARTAAAVPANPFQHPRILIADFLLAEALLRYAFHAVSPRSWILQPSPVAVCHVVEPLVGGLAQIECRALMEMMEGAGARSTFVWEGRELTDQELRSGAYRTPGATDVGLLDGSTHPIKSAAMALTLMGPILQVETIATGRGIRELPRLNKLHGKGRWRKRNGHAEVLLPDGTICRAEIRWYEATGTGKLELKIKRLLD